MAGTESSASSAVSLPADDGDRETSNRHDRANGSIPGKGLTNGSAGNAHGSETSSSSPPPARNGTSPASDIFGLGFELTDLYKHALKFYKDYEMKAFTTTYEDRNKLAALTLQSKHGPMMSEKEPQLGALDFVGRDRRQAWQDLGSLSQEQAMRQFIHMLNGLCPLFFPFIEAHAKERQERKHREVIESQRASEELQSRRCEQELKRFESQKKAVQEVLNRQTYSQFLSYADQQYPAEPEKQQHLIHQLQEQHYQQYMQQMLQLQPLQSPSSISSESPVPSSTSQQADLPPKSPLLPACSNYQSYQSTNQNQSGSDKAADEEDEDRGETAVESAKMWTRQDMAAFKDAIRADGAEGMISVNHGEVVTIKVPTHEDGSCIFWEFCTDTYDIGFGVLFEWTPFPGNQVSVHVSESEDEEDDDESAGRAADAEKVAAHPDTSQEVIIPVFRRDSHEEVFVGSHTYPGKGVYHLKFDNTYSLWRSKTLYYRVYYTR